MGERLKELWRVQSIHHWRHWDFWASHLLMFGGAYALVFEIFYLYKHRTMLLTLGDVATGLGIGFVTFVIQMVGTGWTIHVNEKYGKR